MPPPEQQWRWQRLSPRAAAATSRGSGGSVLLREWQGRPPPVSGDSGSPTTSGVAASSPTTGSAAASSPNTGNGGGALPHHRLLLPNPFLYSLICMPNVFWSEFEKLSRERIRVYQA
ncbi:hypothetical protein OsJ_17475 [Oryza sativa Japonica Group]|uniref:Uncharacterized protein n=2 Tax=Oryza TaxID=4527 RepID=B9FIL0_ORYSJ|nr:hypothetical protein OsJ_17475 [Oryza sativa Japonica Group]